MKFIDEILPIRFVFRFDFNIASKHWQFQSTNPIQSIRSDLNPFGPIRIHFFVSISRLWLRFNPILFPIQSNRSDSIHSVRFDPIQVGSEFDSIQFLLFPIQSNRSGSFGPIRSDSIRFRIRYNAFGPIQIF